MKSKRKNRIKKAITKKPEQIGICRFIDFKDIKHPKINGHYTHHPVFTVRQGLQVEHILYYIEANEIKRALINKHSAKILKVYDGVPEWASEQLIKKQNNYLKSRG